MTKRAITKGGKEAEEASIPRDLIVTCWCVLNKKKSVENRNWGFL